VGVLLYELTVGQRLPREHRDLESMIGEIEKPIEPPSTLDPCYPQALEAVVMKALASQPEERFIHAGAMRSALYEYARQRGLFWTTADVGEFVRRQLGFRDGLFDETVLDETVLDETVLDETVEQSPGRREQAASLQTQETGTGPTGPHRAVSRERLADPSFARRAGADDGTAPGLKPVPPPFDHTVMVTPDLVEDEIDLDSSAGAEFLVERSDFFKPEPVQGDSIAPSVQEQTAAAGRKESGRSVELLPIESDEVSVSNIELLTRRRPSDEVEDWHDDEDPLLAADDAKPELDSLELTDYDESPDAFARPPTAELGRAGEARSALGPRNDASAGIERSGPEVLAALEAALDSALSSEPGEVEYQSVSEISQSAEALQASATPAVQRQLSSTGTLEIDEDELLEAASISELDAGEEELLLQPPRPPALPDPRAPYASAALPAPPIPPALPAPEIDGSLTGPLPFSPPTPRADREQASEPFDASAEGGDEPPHDDGPE
jgi:hypothetical protein